MLDEIEWPEMRKCEQSVKTLTMKTMFFVDVLCILLYSVYQKFCLFALGVEIFNSKCL